MCRNTQHENVGARAEHAILQAGDHHGANFGVFKTDALQGIVQFNVHAQVIRVELEFVAWANAGVFVDVDRQGGHGTGKGQADVLVVLGRGLVIDDGRCGHKGLQ